VKSVPEVIENDEERRKAIEWLLAELEKAEQAAKSPEDWISQEEVMSSLRLKTNDHLK
jgi:hypothetical protein